MISASDRENAVLLINEAIKSGASCKKACECLRITERTFYRWKKRKADTDSYEDGRPSADHSNPANKIPAEICREIINICNRPEYASMAPPCEIVPALADEGIADCQHSCQYFLYFLCLPEGIPDWIKMLMVNSSAGTTCSLTS